MAQWHEVALLLLGCLPFLPSHAHGVALQFVPTAYVAQAAGQGQPEPVRGEVAARPSEEAGREGMEGPWKERQARAGGWTDMLPKKRMMEEAFGSLWVN